MKPFSSTLLGSIAQLLEPLHITQFFSRFFSTGLVRLYIAGLPLISCQTMQGVLPNVCFFIFGSSRIRNHILVITMRTSYRCSPLTPDISQVYMLDT